MGLLLACCASVGLPASCAHVTARPLPTVGAAAWHQDLSYFERELPRRHKNAFHHVSRDSFEHAVAALDARLPQLGDADVVLGIQRITASVGDTHTGTFLPTNFHRYPIALRPFGDDYRVVGVAAEGRSILGGTLVDIGGVPIAEARARMSAFLPQAENRWCVRGNLPAWLTITEALRNAGIAHDSAALSYGVLDSSGQRVHAELRPVPLRTGTTIALSTARVDTPLYARQRSAPLWFVPRAGDSCVFVVFTGYPHLARYAGPLWDWVDRHPTTTLIVDLRRNRGGNFITGRRAVVDPARRRVRSGKLRKVYVLIGNTTLSAAMVNAIDFRTRCHAVLVGEPIGERPNSYSERRLMTLPRSRVVVTYSVRYYRFQESDDPPTVMPDVIIEPTWEDFRSARDPVLEWALAHREGSPPGASRGVASPPAPSRDQR